MRYTFWVTVLWALEHPLLALLIVACLVVGLCYALGVFVV